MPQPPGYSSRLDITLAFIALFYKSQASVGKSGSSRVLGTSCVLATKIFIVPCLLKEFGTISVIFKPVVSAGMIAIIS